MLISNHLCREEMNQFSIRSSSNNMLVSYLNTSSNSTAHSYYTSMESDGSPFVPGCGGYIVDRGQLTAAPTEQMNSYECVWYLETSEPENSLLLINNSTETSSYSMTVYDGWNITDAIIYHYNETSNPIRASIPSYSNRVHVRFLSELSTSQKNTPHYSWRVSTTYSNGCQTHLTEPAGTIKSPDFPLPYPAASDCSWTLQVEAGFKIHLLFATFETQTDHDTFYVYDGPSEKSALIMEISGRRPLATVDSSSNQMFVRFVSDDQVSGPGFLAIYSSVL